jgi:erythromycin esterase
MHGAHEPLAFRNRLFRFLVEQEGFTAIALESGFTEAINARPFVERGEGVVASAVRSGLPGLDEYSETRELLQWMRDYNASAASRGRRPIRLYGIDMAAGGRLSGPRRTIDSALTYLSGADPVAAQTIRSSLNDALPPIDSRDLGSLSTTAQAQFEAVIEIIAKALRANRQSLIARSSREDYGWALHNLDVARQLAKCLPVTPLAGADMNHWAHATECRDAAMAENVQWALHNEGEKGRLLVFAHNGHVMAAKDDGRRMANVPEKPPLMGLPLRRAYGNGLYIVCVVAATTSEGLLRAKPLETGSIERTLAGVNLPLLFLDVRTARQNMDAFAWRSTIRSVGANVSAQGLITLETAVDGIVFVNTLTPAVQYSSVAR